MRKTRIFTAISATIVASVLLAGCASAQPPASISTPDVQDATDSIVAQLGLGGLDVRQVVDALDAMPKSDRPAGVTSSITATELVLTDATGKVEKLQIPDDLIYVSLAPYVSKTHDCYHHSPTGCIGELQNADIKVTVQNAATGQSLLEESLRTFDNGFVGLWLPRGIETKVTITYDGRVATTNLSTAGDDAQTCVTTLQLT